MIETVTFSHFVDSFRSIRPDNFTHQGLSILFDYMEELEDSIGEKFELDVIALCCDYNEMSVDEIIAYYNIRDDINLDVMDDDEKRDIVRDYLEYHTSVCGETDDGFVFATF